MHQTNLYRIRRYKGFWGGYVDAEGAGTFMTLEEAEKALLRVMKSNSAAYRRCQIVGPNCAVTLSRIDDRRYRRVTSHRDETLHFSSSD